MAVRIRIADDPLPRGWPVRQLDLDRPLGDGLTLGEWLGLAVRADQGTALEREMQRAEIGRAIGVLSVRDRLIVSAVFGLDAAPPLVLSDVASALGVTKQAIHQRLRHALEALAGTLKDRQKDARR